MIIANASNAAGATSAYRGASTSAPDPSSLQTGTTAWFTDKPDSNGGGFVVRGTSTPGTNIWDRVGGGPIVADTYANIISGYGSAYIGCTALAIDVGLNGSMVRRNTNYWRVDNTETTALNSAAIGLGFIVIGGGGATWSRDASGLVTFTWAAHGFTADQNGYTAHVTQGALSTGATNITTGWGFTNFTYVDANTFTVQTTVLSAATGSGGSNTSETFYPSSTEYTAPTGMLLTGDSISFAWLTLRKANANSKTYRSYFDSVLCSTTAQTTATTYTIAATGSVYMISATKYVTNALSTTINTLTTPIFTYSCQLANAGDWAIMIPERGIYNCNSAG